MSVPPLIYIILTPCLKQTNIQLWTGTISLPLCPHFVKNLIRLDSLSFLWYWTASTMLPMTSQMYSSSTTIGLWYPYWQYTITLCRPSDFGMTIRLWGLTFVQNLNDLCIAIESVFLACWKKCFIYRYTCVQLNLEYTCTLSQEELPGNLKNI